MKKNFIPSLCGLCLLILHFPLFAQEAELTKDFKKSSIQRFAELLEERYVFPEKGKETGEYLQKQLKAGRFDKVEDMKAFAEALTDEAQKITKDKHLNVREEVPRIRKKVLL